MPGPYHAKAQALLSAIANGGAVPISGESYTYSETTGWTNSSLNGATDTTASLKPLAANTFRFGTSYEANSGAGAPYTTVVAYNRNDYTIGSGNGAGYGFQINASAFDMFIANDGATFRIKVNGAFLPQLFRTSGAYGYRKITFGSKAVRNIEVVFGPAPTVAGFNVAAGDTIGPLPASITGLPKSAIWGDSYVEGIYTLSDGGHVDANDIGNPDTFPVRLREQMGLPAMWLLGRGGQGAVQQANSQSFLTRAQANDFRQPGTDLDLLILFNSINDWDDPAATVQANWQTIIQKAMADQPNAIILGFTGFWTPGFAVDAAHNAAFINAFNAVKDAQRMRLWDGAGQIINSGNAAGYLAGDQIHLNAAGAAFAAGIVKNQLATLLQGF